MKSNFIAGRRFSDYCDLNRQALSWCDEKNRRIHGSTGERPIDRLKEENLKPLPTFNKYRMFMTEARKVQKDALVSYDGVRYGVPWQYSGHEVLVRELSGTIEILYDEKVIATHQKRYTSRSTCYLEAQYQGIKKAEGRLYPKPRATKLASTELFPDPMLAAAMIDRITHRSHILDMNGASYRLAETKRRQSKGGAQFYMSTGGLLLVSMWLSFIWTFAEPKDFL